MRVWGFFALVFVLGLGLRVCGLSQLYHQDEYKWALAADAASGSAQSILHPPLALFLYHHIGSFIGYENLRIVPAFLSLVLLVLLFVYLRSFFTTRAALLGSLLFAVTPYALLGSLQIDIDGVFLPLMTLIAFLGYLLWQRASSFQEKKWGLWLGLGGLVLGFACKLSFVLVPLVLLVDVLMHSQKARLFLGKKEVWASLVGGAALLGAVLALVWNHVYVFRYVDNFVAFHGRDYVEILFLSVKGGIYLSPLLFFGMFLGVRYRKELSLWYFFLLANFLFYFVAFDFSHRTFDRYLLFLVLPACVITAVWLDRALRIMTTKDEWRLFGIDSIFAFFLGVFVFDIFSLPHRVIPLLPKAAFIDAVMHGHWGFLLPMTGGSGPLGFYLPVDALAVLWGVSGVGALLALVGGLWWKKAGLTLLLSASLIYTGFVNSEYLFGAFYGNAGSIVSSLIQEIDRISSKEDVYQGLPLVRPLMRSGGIITYNDIGAYSLYARGLYAGRFYPHDQFVEGNRIKFAAHPGYYLFVNMPALGASSVYTKYFAQCVQVAGKQSGQIAGYLLDCSRADPSVIRLGPRQ